MARCLRLAGCTIGAMVWRSRDPPAKRVGGVLSFDLDLGLDLDSDPRGRMGNQMDGERPDQDKAGRELLAGISIRIPRLVDYAEPPLCCAVLCAVLSLPTCRRRPGCDPALPTGPFACLPCVIYR